MTAMLIQNSEYWSFNNNDQDDGGGGSSSDIHVHVEQGSLQVSAATIAEFTSTINKI